MDGAEREEGVRERRRREGKARVLDAARALFETDGVAGLNIRLIAKRAGMPTMSLYRHFPHKTAIIRALWSEAFGPLFAELDAAEAASVDPEARLRNVAQTFVDYWLRFPARYRIVFLIEDHRESEDDTWFIQDAEVAPELRRFAKLLGALHADRAPEAEADGEALFCALIGISHLLIGMPEYRWADSHVYVERILRGFV